MIQAHLRRENFGFYQTTFQGPNAMNTTWESDWCTYFSRLLLDWLDREVAHNGPQPEYEAYYKRFVAKIVPQILEPLQSDGRILKPCLIHGDLWEENTGVNLENGKPVVFDACVMYAHNEMELGMWRNGRDRFGKPFFRQYLGLMRPSESVEEFDDRDRVYAMKYALSHILGWPDTSTSGRQSYVISLILRHLLIKLTSSIGFGTRCAIWLTNMLWVDDKCHGAEWGHSSGSKDKWWILNRIIGTERILHWTLYTKEQSDRQSLQC